MIIKIGICPLRPTLSVRHRTTCKSNPSYLACVIGKSFSERPLTAHRVYHLSFKFQVANPLMLALQISFGAIPLRLFSPIYIKIMKETPNGLCYAEHTCFKPAAIAAALGNGPLNMERKQFQQRWRNLSQKASASKSVGSTVCQWKCCLVSYGVFLKSDCPCKQARCLAAKEASKPHTSGQRQLRIPRFHGKQSSKSNDDADVCYNIVLPRFAIYRGPNSGSTTLPWQAALGWVLRKDRDATTSAYLP